MTTNMTTMGAWVIVHGALEDCDYIYTTEVFATPKDCLFYLEDEIVNIDDIQEFHLVNIHSGQECSLGVEFFVEEL